MALVTDVRRVFRLLDPQLKRRFFVVLVFMFLAAGLQVVSVASIFPFLSVITNPEVVETGWFHVFYSGLGFRSVEQFLGVLALVVFFLVVAANGVVIAQKWLHYKFQHNASHSMAMGLLRTYLHKDYSFFLHRNSAELQKNVVEETHRIATNLLNASLHLISGGLLAIGIIALLLVADPVSTFIVIAVIGGGYVVIYRFIRHKLSNLGQEYVTHNRERHQAALESFGGIKDVKLLGREQALVDRFEPASKGWADGLAKYHVFREMPRYVIETLAMGGLLLVLAVLLLTGQPVAAIIPLMGLFVFAGYRLMPVFKELLAATAAFRFNEALLQLVEDDLDQGPPTLPVEGNALRSLPFSDSLVLENATFSYPRSSSSVLSGVSVSVPKNSTVAFVGETGAGKTTLVDILLGLYSPVQGRLLVDDVIITGDNVRQWQRNVGYVPQEIFLTDDTVRRNIAFALPDKEIDNNAVEHAAKIAHIHQFIVEELPEGYDTIIGERGVRLSGGQRQRLGIARALYHDPEVLVLDEATSDIDNVTEANITEAIEELSGMKTLVIIAHRLSTIRNADQIYVLEHGRIVGKGTYNELVAHNKEFIDLARHTDAVVRA